MIITSMIVENFRCFYSEVEFIFPCEKGKNTTIIFAQNGVGKTNLLNAFLWCFHGQTSSGLKQTASEKLLNKTASLEGRKSFHVTIEFENEEKKYRIKRSGGDTTNFKIWMIHDGNTQEIKQNPTLFVNSIIPKDMTSYFINDGEGDDLAINADGTISISRSIADILGFGIAKKSLSDLIRIKKEFRDELKKVDSAGNLSEAQQKIQIAEDSLERNMEELESNEKALEDYNQQLENINKQLVKSNSELIKQTHNERIQTEKDLEVAKRKLADFEKRKITLIRKFYAVAFADGLSIEALDFIKDSENKGKLPAPWNEKFVKDVLEAAECICGTEVKEGTTIYKRIESMLKKAANPELIDRIQKARAQLTSVKTLRPYASEEINSNRIDIQTLESKIRSLTDKIDELSITIESFDQLDDITQLEKDRRRIQSAITETSKTIGRKTLAVEQAKKAKEKAELDCKKLQSFVPTVERMMQNIEVVEKIEGIISKELDNANSEYPSVLEGNMNDFLKKYLRQDYVARMDSDHKKIGLCDRDGDDIGVSEGQGALLKFIYIASLVNIARVRRDLKSTILTPGAVAPLIFDAPFSDLDSSYARSIAGALPDLVDQLIIISYPDAEKGIDDVIRKSGKLNRVYYLQLESAGSRQGKDIKPMTICGQEVQSIIYDAPKDRVRVLEG